MAGKRDLSEETLKSLADLLSLFKSEAVQLRILDLLYGRGRSQEDDAEASAPSATKPGKRRAGKAAKATREASSGEGARANRAKAVGRGAWANLKDLVDKGYFKQTRTISEITKHLEVKAGRKFKSSDLSSSLTRFVRNERLDREKNAESNQYEYVERP